MFDTKLKLRYLLSDLKTMTFEKIRVGSYVTNTMTKLILVDPVEDEMLKRLVHGLILQTSYNAILNKIGKLAETALPTGQGTARRSG